MKRRKRSQWVSLRGDDIGGRLEERGVAEAREEEAEKGGVLNRSEDLRKLGGDPRCMLLNTLCGWEC